MSRVLWPEAGGLNENTNGLISQYFHRNRDFTTVTEQEIKMAMDKLNNRPRKCLDMKTPNQVFFGMEALIESELPAVQGRTAKINDVSH